MRLGRLFVTLTLGAALTASVAGCSKSDWLGDDVPPLPTVANVQQESTLPMAQALARFSYKPIVPLYGRAGANKNKRTGTIFLICDGKYANRFSECADNYRSVATNSHPAIWVVNDKVIGLIGSRSTSFMDNRNFVVNVPKTPSDSMSTASSSASSPDPSASAGPTTWQDFTRLTSAQQTTLVTTVVPSAKKLCCGSSALASVYVDGPGQVTAGWDEV
jgi:hypothetical protein